MENKIIKAGTRIVIGMNAGMCGTDNMEGYVLTQDYTDEELGDIAWNIGVEHASMYGVYPECDRPEGEEDDEDGETYSENIEGWWEEYNQEKHEGHITYGMEGPTFKEL
jgi:hypothetical protein